MRALDRSPSRSTSLSCKRNQAHKATRGVFKGMESPCAGLSPGGPVQSERRRDSTGACLGRKERPRTLARIVTACFTGTHAAIDSGSDIAVAGGLPGAHVPGGTPTEHARKAPDVPEDYCLQPHAASLPESCAAGVGTTPLVAFLSHAMHARNSHGSVPGTSSSSVPVTADLVLATGVPLHTSISTPFVGDDAAVFEATAGKLSHSRSGLFNLGAWTSKQQELLHEQTSCVNAAATGRRASVSASSSRTLTQLQYGLVAPPNMAASGPIYTRPCAVGLRRSSSMVRSEQQAELLGGLCSPLNTRAQQACAVQRWLSGGSEAFEHSATARSTAVMHPCSDRAAGLSTHSSTQSVAMDGAGSSPTYMLNGGGPTCGSAMLSSTTGGGNNRPDLIDELNDNGSCHSVTAALPFKPLFHAGVSSVDDVARTGRYTRSRSSAALPQGPRGLFDTRRSTVSPRPRLDPRLSASARHRTLYLHPDMAVSEPVSPVHISTLPDDTPPLTQFQTSQAAMRAVPPMGMRDFQILATISEGHTADVHQAFDTVRCRPVMLKVYHLPLLDAYTHKQMRREIDILSSLAGSQHCMQLWAAFQEDDHYVLVMEHCDAGDLNGILARHGGKLSEHHAVTKVLHPLMLALQEMHAAGFVHRDVTPANICFTKDGQLRLCDMGLAINARQDVARSRVGTLGYMAPELFSRSSNGGADDVPASGASSGGPGTSGLMPKEACLDIWSLGVIAHYLIIGIKPYPDQSPRRDAALAMQAMPDSPPPGSEVAVDAWDFVKQALQLAPHLRPSATQLLAHPWVARVMRAHGESCTLLP